MRIHFYAMLREAVGAAHIDYSPQPNQTIRQLFDVLANQYPELAPRLLDAAGELSPHIVVFLDRQEILLGEGLDTTLDDAEMLQVFAQISGG